MKRKVKIAESAKVSSENGNVMDENCNAQRGNCYVNSGRGSASGGRSIAPSERATVSAGNGTATSERGIAQIFELEIHIKYLPCNKIYHRIERIIRIPIRSISGRNGQKVC